MIRRFAELTQEARENIRGGHGRAKGADYLKEGEMAGLLSLGRTTLEQVPAVWREKTAALL